MKTIIIIITILISSKCFAFDFTERKETTARQMCFLFMLLEDHRQTSNIKHQPVKYEYKEGKTTVIKHCEKNEILGKFPSQSSIDLYFIGCAVGHTVISYMLPEKYAKFWQCVWIGIESNTLSNNYERHNESVRLNYSVKFDFEF